MVAGKCLGGFEGSPKIRHIKEDLIPNWAGLRCLCLFLFFLIHTKFVLDCKTCIDSFLQTH